MRASLSTIHIHADLRYASGCIAARPGLILRLNADGLTGLGEASPLPAFGGEPFAACLSALRRCLPILEQSRAPIQHLLASLRATPVAHSCVVAALLDLSAKQRDRPLASILRPGAALQVHANWLGPQPPSDWQICKCKALPDPVDSARMLRDLHHQRPDLRLRLDANGSWSLDDALLFARAAKGLPIDLLEQPCAPRHDRDLPQIQCMTGLPIGLDESFRHISDLPRLLALRPAALVIKPMLLGGADLALLAARRCHAAGVRVIVTDSICTAVGRHHAAHIAAACDRNEYHGLATAGLLGEQDPFHEDCWPLNSPGIGL